VPALDDDGPRPGARTARTASAGSTAENSEGARGVVRLADGPHGLPEERLGFVRVDREHGGDRQQLPKYRSERASRQEPCPAPGGAYGGVDDDGEAATALQESGDGTDVPRAPQRTDLDGANALVPQNLEGLGRHPARFERRRGTEPGGRLHGEDRDRRAAEDAGNTKGPQIGRYSRATARVEATDGERADGGTHGA
jgi:hypothetical protein